jgi:hypothetical protein
MAEQRDWRFCIKCSEMFFDGAPNKGTCPAGGGHAAQGFMFVLPHDLPESPTAQSRFRTTSPNHPLRRRTGGSATSAL